MVSRRGVAEDRRRSLPMYTQYSKCDGDQNKPIDDKMQDDPGPGIFEPSRRETPLLYQPTLQSKTVSGKGPGGGCVRSKPKNSCVRCLNKTSKGSCEIANP